MLQKLKNNNNGNIEITRVICYFYLIVCIAFVLDIIVVIGQNVVTSYEAAYYAEKVSIQGGLLGDVMEYPSIAEAKRAGNGNACYNFRKPCTSCLINSDMTKRISKTLGYFGVSSGEWAGYLESSGERTIFHSKMNQATGVSNRKVYDYMSTATFIISSDWQPIFAKYLWGKDVYTIDKYVPIVIEYIPQVDRNDPNCKNLG